MGCPSSAGVPRFRPVLGEGGDHLNQQQPDHESPQAAGVLLQALPAQRSETQQWTAACSFLPRLPRPRAPNPKSSFLEERIGLAYVVHGTPPSSLLQRPRDDAPPPPPPWLPQAAQFCPRLCPQGLKKMPPEKLSRIPELIEPWFIFSLIWSVGATGDSTSRSKFSHWLRIKMKTENVRGSRPSSLGWAHAPWAGLQGLGRVC